MYFSKALYLAASLFGLATASPILVASRDVSGVAQMLNLINSDAQLLSSGVQNFDGTVAGLTTLVKVANQLAQDMANAGVAFRFTDSISLGDSESTIVPIFDQLYYLQLSVDEVLGNQVAKLAATNNCEFIEFTEAIFQIRSNIISYTFLASLVDPSVSEGIIDKAGSLTFDMTEIANRYAMSTPAGCTL